MNRQIFTVALGALLLSSLVLGADETPRKGLIQHEKGADEGYTLFAPLRSTTTYLVDMEGRLVHKWADEYTPGQAVYLLNNGHLLKTASEHGNRAFHGGGLGGRVREFDWDGELVWDFNFSNEQRSQHHDIAPLPNGNVLLIAWEKKTKDEAIAAGRKPGTVHNSGLWPDFIVEVKPEGKTGGTIVWEWHAWDHFVQDCDKTKANYGFPGDHPELIDINYTSASARISSADMERLRAIGYIGSGQPVGPGGSGPGGGADMFHTNSVDYNADLDQIVLSVLNFNEIWIIDHSTTTEEAAGHTGGRYGKGGDLLYRWGNPQTYMAGSPEDQRLFGQHDAKWITKGYPGAGHILVFNNGRGRPDGDYSSVDEIVTPVDSNGVYRGEPEEPFEPEKAAWVFASSTKADFRSGHISGAQRLENGNTLICSGEQGRLFEVTPGGEIVWEFANPYGGDAGPPGFPGGPRGWRPGGPPPGGFWPRLFGPGAGGPRPVDRAGEDDDAARPGDENGPPPRRGSDERPAGDNDRVRPQDDARGDMAAPNGDGPPDRADRQNADDDRPPRQPGDDDAAAQNDGSPRRGPGQRRPGGFRGPGGPFGPGPGGPGGPGDGSAMFRATRIAPSFPGLKGRELTPIKEATEKDAAEKQP